MDGRSKDLIKTLLWAQIAWLDAVRALSWKWILKKILLWLNKWRSPFPLCLRSDEIVSSYAQQAMKSFQVCSASDEIVSVLAQHAFGFIYKKLSKIERWLSIGRRHSVRWNHFFVCSANDEIVSAYAQPAHTIIFGEGTVLWMETGTSITIIQAKPPSTSLTRS
jgi:hypothetical protein